MSKAAVEQSPRQAPITTRVLSRIVEWIANPLIGHPKFGAITIILPDGRARTIGTPSPGLHSVLKLNNFNVIGDALRRGTLGFAEAYMKGDIEIDDLTATFRFFVQNRAMFDDANPGLFRRTAQDIAYHMSRRNTKEGSKRNIAEH